MNSITSSVERNRPLVFDDLLLQLKSIPVLNSSTPTIFEICGFPHYETIASNVLAFYLDSNREHGLADAMLRAVIKHTKAEIEDFQGSFRVIREERTTSGKYIDIYMQNDMNSCILIENKVFASVHNDLDDYHAHAMGNAENGKCICVLLSLFEQKRMNSKFHYVTYEQLESAFWDEIGRGQQEVGGKYIELIRDLFTNMRRLKSGDAQMNYDFAEYVGKNREEIFRLFSELTKFQDSIERLVKQVNVIVEGKLKDHKQRLWPEKKEFSAKAVTELRVGKDKNCSLVIDSTIDPSGWKFELFQRTRSEPQIDFRSSLISEELKGKLTKAQNGLETERYLLEGRFPLSAPPQDVASYIVEVINFSSELPWVVRDAAVDSSQTSG